MDDFLNYITGVVQGFLIAAFLIAFENCKLDPQKPSPTPPITHENPTTQCNPNPKIT